MSLLNGVQVSSVSPGLCSCLQSRGLMSTISLGLDSRSSLTWVKVNKHPAWAAGLYSGRDNIRSTNSPGFGSWPPLPGFNSTTSLGLQLVSIPCFQANQPISLRQLVSIPWVWHNHLTWFRQLVSASWVQPNDLTWFGKLPSIPCVQVDHLTQGPQ